MPDKKKVSEIIPFPEDNSTPSETTVLPFPNQQQPENKDVDITTLKQASTQQPWQQFIPTTMQGHLMNDGQNENLIENVKNGGVTLLGQMNQKAPNLVPQQLQKAQSDVKSEIAAGPDYIKNFVGNNQQVLDLYDNILKGNLAKTMMPTDATNYDKIFDKSSGTKELGTFANASKAVINQQYQNKLEELNRQYPSDNREQDEQYQQLKNTLDKTHDQEIKKLQQSVYPLAQLKTASEFIDNNPKYKEGNNPINSDDLLKIGIEQAKATGTPDIDRLERLYHRGQLTEEEKLYFQKAGGDALLYKANDAFADGNKELAQNIYNNTGDYVRKALDANPQAKKEAVIDAISDEIYKNKDQYYPPEVLDKQGGALVYNFLKDITTEKTIENAAKKIGISPQDYQDVKPDEIKYESSPLQRFGKGFYNAFNPLLDLVGHAAQNSTEQGALTPDIKLGTDIVNPYLNKKLFGGENPNAASLFQTPTIVNTQPGRDYLEQIPNPQQGEFHPTLSNIAGTIAEGIGNIIGFMAPATEGSKALQLAGLVGDAGNANRVATAATVYLNNIENNLQEAKRALPAEGAGKQALLANLYTLSDIIGIELMNPLGIKEKILSPTTPAGQELIDVVKNDGLEGLYRNNNLQKIITKAIDGATESGKDWARMTGGMTSTEVGRYMADMVLAPEKFKKEDNTQGLVQAAVSNGIVNLLPSIASGISHVGATEQMRNNLVYEVGSNPRTYIDGIDAAQRNGQIEEATANQKKQLVEKATNIVKNQVPHNSLVTGQPLTQQERSEYANNLFIESQLLQQKDRSKDAVQDKIIDNKIKDLQDQRKNILEKQPEVAIEQPQVATTTKEQPQNIKDILGAIEEEHPEDILNPKIANNEKNGEASKESGTQEVNAEKGNQIEYGEGQRQGWVLIPEGVAQETTPSITEPVRDEESAAIPKELLTPEPSKPLYEMTSDEVNDYMMEVKKHNNEIEKKVLGDKYKEWKDAQRLQNSMTADWETIRTAGKKVQEIENSLSKTSQAVLYGRGDENAMEHTDLIEYRDALSGIEGSNSESELGNELGKHLITLNNAPLNPDEMNLRQKVALSAIVAAERKISDEGLSKKNVTEIALKKAASKFSDPEDAEFMLSKFLNILKEKQNATEERSPLQNESLPKQSSEPEYPRVEEQRNEATQPETDNSHSLIRESKEIDNHVNDLLGEETSKLLVEQPELKQKIDKVTEDIPELKPEEVDAINELSDKDVQDIVSKVESDKNITHITPKEVSKIIKDVTDESNKRKTKRSKSAQPREGDIENADNQSGNIEGKTEPVSIESPREQIGNGRLETANSVEEAYRKAFADYNKIKDVVIKKEERLQKMEEDGKRDTPEFEKELAAYRKAFADKKVLREELRTAEKEHTKAQAEKFRKNKLNPKEDKNLYGATPPAVLLKAAKDIGVRLYNAAIETIALSMEAGKSIQHAIQDGVDYINERFHAGKWDEEGFRKAISPPNIIQNTAEDIRAAKVEQNPLSQKNQQLVNSMVDLVKNNTESLSSINRKIDNLSLSPTMKEKIKKYIETKIGNETFKVKGNELSEKFLQENNNDPKKALEELNKEEDMMLKSTDNPNEKDNISNEFVYARANLKAKEAQLNEKPTGIPNEPPPSEDPAGEKPDEQVILPEYTKTTEAKIEWQDRIKRLEQYVEERVKTYGEFVNDNEDPWIAMTLKNDRASNKILENKKWINDFTKRLEKDKITVDDIGEYAYAKHAPEANAHIAKIRQQTVEAKLLDLEKELKNTKTDKAKKNIEKEINDIQEQKDPNFALMSDGGSGMENAEAEAVIKKVADEGKTELYDNYLKEFKDNVITPLLDERYDAGLIDKDTYNHLKSYYKDYVPTKIDQDVYNEMRQQNEETIKKGNKKNAIQDANSQLLRRKGSKEFRYTERNNPITQGLNDYAQVILASENNKTYNLIANEIEAHPNPHIWHTEKAQYNLLKDNEGNIIKAYPKNVPNHSVAYYKYGEKHFIVFNDPGLQRIPEKIHVGAVLRALSKITRIKSKVNTTYNPPFPLANAMFDATDASIMLSAKYPEAAKKFKGYYAKLGFTGLLAELNNWKKDSNWKPYIDEIKKEGGLITFGDVLNPHKQAENIHKLYEAQNKSIVGKSIHHIGEVIESGVYSLEQMTRVMVYRSMRETGHSPERSAIMARNATVDFGKKGIYAPYLNAFGPFMNAKIQSSANALHILQQATPQLKALKSGKIVAKTSLKVANAARRSLVVVFLGGLSQAILSRVLNDNSDNPEDHYGEIPDYRKQNKLLVPLKMFGGHGYAQLDLLPKNFNYLWYAGSKFGENIMNAMKGEDTHIAENTKDILIAAHQTMNPIIGSQNLQDVAFGNLGFIPQSIGNRNSLNQPIYPENKPGLKDYETYRDNTPSAYKVFSKALYNTIGVDIHPDMWDYWANQIGGGLYTEGKDAIITGDELVKSEPVNPNTIPMSHRFYSNSGMAGTKERVSNAMEKAQQQGLSAEEYTKAINDITTLYNNGVWSAEKAKRVQSKLERTTKEATQNRLEADYKEATEE